VGVGYFLVGSGTKKMNPITVSIPYFKDPAHIRGSVTSILNQTFRNFSLVVVNDGDSEGPLREALHGIRDPRMITFTLSKNMGRYFADSVVIRATSSPYYVIQDSDDWSEPNRLEVLLQGFKDHPGCFFVGSGMIHRKEDGQVLSRDDNSWANKLPPRPLYPEECKKIACYHHGMFKKNFFDDIGGYYSGTRVSYDSFILYVIRMFGEVYYVKDFLYHIINKRTGSLTQSEITGIGKPHRLKVIEGLNEAYIKIYDEYLKFKKNSISKNDLAKFTRNLLLSRIPEADRKLLENESIRLRRLLM